MDKAWKITKQFLTDDPNDVRALVTASFLMRRAQQLPAAYHFAKASTQIRPTDAATWINLGHVAAELWLTEEAEAAYHTALKCSNIHAHGLKNSVRLNLSALYIDCGRYAEAYPHAMAVHTDDPQSPGARANVGFCQLATRDWSGWTNYRATIGSEWRPRTQYKDEPEWDGTPHQTIVLYGEQGLGDEISFASMLPDAVAHCHRVILDCDPRLSGLFRRSFPAVRVYGTRMAQSGQWDLADRAFDASLPIGQIGEYFRTSKDRFPGTPYLVPCPDRVTQWKALFATQRKPIIGIAWRGGVPKSNARNRQLMLDQFMPVFESLDAHYVSLQYKDAAKEIAEFKARHPQVDLVQYPWGTLTHDYDDTAALIASCDAVICIQTAVAHTAGALGVPVHVLVPVASQWRYGTAHDHIPWYRSLKVIRQKTHGTWTHEIKRLATHLGRLSHAAGAPARNPHLRGGLDCLRAAGLTDHRADADSTRTRLRVRQPNESVQALEGASPNHLSSL